MVTSPILYYFVARFMKIEEILVTRELVKIQTVRVLNSRGKRL